jgi:Peptidase S46
LRTYAQVEYLRDYARPRSLSILGRLSDALNAYGATGEEQRRQAADNLFGIENSRKAYTGELEGLRDPALMARKKASEDELRARIANDPKLAAVVGDAFDALAKIQQDNITHDHQRAFRRMQGSLGGHAVSIVRFVEEVTKPNGERLPPFRDSSLDSTKLELFSTAPIYPGLEETLLRTGFELAVENLGGDDAFVQSVLGGESPAAAAKRLVSGTKLSDPEVRKKLVDGGKEAVAKSTDPLIVLARKIDPMLRELVKRQEEASAVTADQAAKIAQAKFEVYGNSVYPDATFTLRLAAGTVAGYPEDTTLVPWKTTFYGLFERNAAFDGKAPFELPKRYLERRSKIALETPLNFVHTCDITGGNSGSPTLNRAGEIVGLVFDGNIQSLPNDLIYGNGADRALSVHCAGIVESLKSIYDAHELVAELEKNGARDG